MTLVAGTRLGSYEVTSLLGAGGMGEVYRARDPRLGRDVAIKVLPTAFAADAERLRRFEQEARAAAAINHPNILVVYDVGLFGPDAPSDLSPAGQAGRSSPYVVSELLDGETLGDRLRHGPLPVRRAVGYAVQMTRGLAAAHEKGSGGALGTDAGFSPPTGATGVDTGGICVEVLASPHEPVAIAAAATSTIATERDG